MPDLTNTSPKTLLVLGATSGIAQAYLRHVASKHRDHKYILVGRNAEKLDIVQKDIAGRSLGNVLAITAEIGVPKAIVPTMAKIIEAGGVIDECLVAYGALGEQQVLQADLTAANALFTTNFVSAGLWLEAIAALFEKQNSGHVVAIASVAGDRGRQSNYLYGATKAGLERICEGMAHRFSNAKNIHVTCIKPGLVDTPMTEQLSPSGPLWAKPETVARDIYRAVKRKRTRIYTPWFWRPILMIVRALPVSLFHRTRL